MLTETSTYVSTRIEMINDHFELFLRCGGLSDFYIDKMLLSAKNHELEAVGIYIEENGYRIAEVEFNVDWNKHNDLVKLHGEWFDTNCPGWKNG